MVTYCPSPGVHVTLLCNYTDQTIAGYCLDTHIPLPGFCQTIKNTQTFSMKKQQYLFLLFLSFLAAGSAQAQRLDIFGGLNSSNFKHKIAGTGQDGTGTIGYHFGMAVFIPFDAKASSKDQDGSGIRPSLQYVRKGTSKSTILGPSVADVKLNYLQLDIPLSYTSGFGGVGIGPYAAYAMSGRKKYRVGNGNKEKIDFGNELKNLDFGVGINFKIAMFKIQYDLGLANLAKAANGTVKTRNLSVSFEIPLVE